jgi:hypothetical protein
MKATTALFPLLCATLFTAVPAQAGEWFACGDLTQIGWSCQLANYPTRNYEYGIAYNSAEPHAVACLYWNYGMRIQNRLPYITFSDNPQTGSRWGGFILYTGTLASDDDICTNGSWRHQYWHLDPNNVVVTPGGNGCLGSSTTIYCRVR